MMDRRFSVRTIELNHIHYTQKNIAHRRIFQQ